MRLHRFYVGDKVQLTHDFWINNSALIRQWQKVFRLSAGAEVVLFDGTSHDRLYKITKLDSNGTHLKHVTDLKRQVPKPNVYLLWSQLKKDNNDLVLQKCTELGVSHFVPLLTERTEKKGFDPERAKKIIIEAAEQCGRSDIPTVREPMLLTTAIEDYKHIPLYVCEQGNKAVNKVKDEYGVIIGPEGGWSDKEKQQLAGVGLVHIGLGDFTLRAETAAIASVARLTST